MKVGSKVAHRSGEVGVVTRISADGTFIEWKPIYSTRIDLVETLNVLPDDTIMPQPPVPTLEDEPTLVGPDITPMPVEVPPVVETVIETVQGVRGSITKVLGKVL